MDQKVEKKDGQRLERKRWQRTEQGGEEMEERKGCSKLCIQPTINIDGSLLCLELKSNEIMQLSYIHIPECLEDRPQT
jgi:hypothetical protein